MLISDKYNFIFIHIYKNAGTSITDALLRKAMNKAEYFKYKVYPRLGKPYKNNLSLYPGHIKAKELRTEIGAEKYNKYFKFAIVRNPWDWQVSLYKYMLKNEKHHQHEMVKSFGTFDKYIEWRCAEEVRLQKDFLYSTEGELLVDYVGRFENLEKDFQEICSTIKIKTHLPKLNVSNTKPYKEYYNNKTKELVDSAFHEDIECFKYSF